MLDFLNKSNYIVVKRYLPSGDVLRHKVRKTDFEERETLNINGHDYTVDNESYVFERGYKTFYYHKNEPAPINLKEGNSRGRNVTSKELNSYLQNNIVKDLMKAGKEDNTDKILLLCGVVTILGLAALGYFVHDLLDQISNLQEIVENIESMNEKNVENTAVDD